MTITAIDIRREWMSQMGHDEAAIEESISDNPPVDIK